jgi:hypothetical protein
MFCRVLPLGPYESTRLKDAVQRADYLPDCSGTRQNPPVPTGQLRVEHAQRTTKKNAGHRSARHLRFLCSSHEEFQKGGPKKNPPGPSP